MRGAAMHEGEKRELIFIVGVGRSGTSLLQSMLNAHPGICFVPETAFVRRYLATGSLDRTFRAGGAEAVVSVLEADSRLARLGVQRAALRELVLGQGSAFAARRLFLDLLDAYCARREAGRFVGDKDPRSVEVMKAMKKRFPGAFVLHTIRDPRGVLASKKKAAWSRGRPALSHLFAHRVQEKMGREWGPRLFGARYVEVKYEALLRDPETVLAGICQRLGLAFDPQMLQFAASSRELVAQDEMDWKRETLGPLLAGNSGKWRTELTPWEVALAEAVCAEAMRRGGYPSSAAGASFERTAAAVLGAGMALADPLYRRYRLWRQG